MKIVIAVSLLLCTVIVNAQVKVGTVAPEISLPNANGDTIALSSLKGKVVMIDFWASWCGPCRRSNPHVVRLYEKYKDKGFEVFGVSIDSRKDAWLKAVKHDKIKYTQVLDNGGWNAVTAAKYGVEAIPSTFLLNKEGVVVAVDLEGLELEERVADLIK